MLALRLLAVLARLLAVLAPPLARGLLLLALALAQFGVFGLAPFTWRNARLAQN
ncbi:hypothetical protein CALCODRAFT_483173 [Calocera cornea HHB12733]|uniref:Uncharacterized protein n=1 Tax=Calocera cornea HHB12733 TaxID=1353952 RepID=A0A165G217_9BASI|nr:hypothetical protein CALCODRAFT_483173 [Calocera cornea HHB12733]